MAGSSPRKRLSQSTKTIPIEEGVEETIEEEKARVTLVVTSPFGAEKKITIGHVKLSDIETLDNSIQQSLNSPLVYNPGINIVDHLGVVFHINPANVFCAALEIG